MIRFGTAGWQYRDWEGIVYPKPRPRGFDQLAYLANFFDLVEINSSFYGPPQPNASRSWVARVAAHPEFRFTTKLWKGFTHERNATAADERLFKEGIEPLVNAGRRGAVLLQFPGPFETSQRTAITCGSSESASPNIRWSWKFGMAVGSSRECSTR
jgi:uncharacterized protein YecE (DUF72 family)